jgi:hypothetical protein
MIASDHGVYRGVFLLRNIPAGRYQAILSRVGGKTSVLEDVRVTAGSPTRFEWRLGPDPIAGNLVRNPDFSLLWSGPGPDYWQFENKSGEWVSDNIRIQGGTEYKVFMPARLKLKIVWYKNHWQAAAEPIEVSQAPRLLRSPSNAMYARLLVNTAGKPDRETGEVGLVQVDSQETSTSGR